jgi:hypothetical protein
LTDNKLIEFPKLFLETGIPATAIALPNRNNYASAFELQEKLNTSDLRYLKPAIALPTPLVVG